MAYETKAIFSLLAQSVARAKSVKEAYGIITTAAGVEGLKLPTYEEYLAAISEGKEESK